MGILKGFTSHADEDDDLSAVIEQDPPSSFAAAEAAIDRAIRQLAGREPAVTAQRAQSLQPAGERWLAAERRQLDTGRPGGLPERRQGPEFGRRRSD